MSHVHYEVYYRCIFKWSFGIVVIETTIMRRTLKLGLGEKKVWWLGSCTEIFQVEENKSNKEVIFKAIAVILKYKLEIYIYLFFK